MERIKINDPEFNIRELVKQLLLLEDHLTDDEKYCEDCIKKHMLMSEALAEEALTLDKHGQWISTASSLAKQARTWLIMLADGDDRYVIAQAIRKTRKKLIERVYDPRIYK